MIALEQKAKEGLLYNFDMTGGRYICPAWPHYPWQWAWDSCFHAIVCAHLGLTDLAKNEITKLLSVQVRDGYRRGFIPHQIYWPKIKGFNKRGWMDWERFLYKDWMPLVSPLPAQPVLAQAVRVIGDNHFFLEHVNKIIDFYRYYDNVLDPDNDGLVSIFSPRSSGRDSSPEFDFFRFWGLRLPKSLKFLDTILDGFSLLWLEFRYKLMGWDEKKIFKSKIFDVQDLAIQCIYIDALYDLVWMMENCLPAGDLAKREGDVNYFKRVIQKAEKAVLEKCWNEEDRAFYSLRNDREQLRDLTVASLFPLAIKDLPEDKLDVIVTALEDKDKFNTLYPVPSVAVSHHEFNPSSPWPLWRGGTWANMNWFIIRWLLRHGKRELAWRIAEPNIRIAEKDFEEDRDPFPEFRNPLTGKAIRTTGMISVSNFGWAKLVVTFKALFDNYEENH